VDCDPIEQGPSSGGNVLPPHVVPGRVLTGQVIVREAGVRTPKVAMLALR
jgi:hypothetical protein